MNAKANGKTPLDWAMMEGGRLFVRFLREHGGKTAGELKAEADRIIGAAKDGDVEAVKQAIADRVDVNAKDSGGWTPLLHAVRADHKEVAELLIAKGADVNAKFDDGQTPLHYAAQQGHKETAELLIGNGADVNAKDNAGKTPLDWAIQKSRTETADLIRKHQLMPRLVQHGRFAFSFDAKEGKIYEVQDSFDLLNWEPIRTYTGAGDTVRFDEDRDHDPPQWFYRVKMVE
ncbi:ankyrin repeat domain-containing protein [bacterium]|nr:ankyrin repeat domain-containing protein [bacterium]